MHSPQLWLSAIELGCFYALLGLAYLLSWLGSGDFNFVVGPLAVLSPLLMAWMVTEQGLPLWLGVAAGLIVAGIVSGLVEFAVVRPISARTDSELPVVFALAAVLFVVSQFSGEVFGRLPVAGVSIVRFNPVFVGGTVLTPVALTLVPVALVVSVIIALWIRQSASGRLLRAVGNNVATAKLLGLPVNRIRSIAFVLSGVIAGLAGVLYAPKAGIQFSFGLHWALLGFMVIVVGGTGSIWGPLVGGLLLGVIEVMLPFYYDTAATNYAILTLAIVFFALRPTGLFTKRVRV